jgi:hypothetical protein
MIAGENFTDSARGSFTTFNNTAIGTNTRTEHMRITSAGNVGIGTTTPAAKLDVNGDARFNNQVYAGKNAIINGSYDVWARGTSFASTGGAYTADRWYSAASGSGSTTISRQSPGSTLPDFQYAIRTQRNSGSTETTSQQLGYTLETADSLRFAGKTATISFYARAGANYSPSSSGLFFILNTGTGTDQRVLGGGFTGNTNPLFTSATLSTSWQRYSYQVSIPSTSTQIGFYWQANVTGTAGANDWFEITGVMLELGAAVTNFSRSAGNIQQELAACQRYYWRFTSDTVYQAFGSAMWEPSSVIALGFVDHPIVMRTVPSSIDFLGPLMVYDGNTAIGINSIAIGSFGSRKRSRLNLTLASSATSNRPYEILSNNSTASYIGFSAEL